MLVWFGYCSDMLMFFKTVAVFMLIKIDFSV
jgi:hypothetical protein